MPNPVEFTPEILKRYIRGQMEIQNPEERYLYRGEIESIGINDSILMVRFAWLAKGKGYPPLPERWIKDDNPALLDYAASLGYYSVSDIGDDRICLACDMTGEIAVLFPHYGSMLDPAKVQGLARSTPKSKRKPRDSRP